MNNRKILVTGATGFIGKSLVSMLSKQGCQQLVLSRQLQNNSTSKNIHYLLCDLSSIDTQKKYIKKFQPDVIIHLGWQGIPDFSHKMCQLNLNNTINLIDIVTELDSVKKIIVSGSCFEYDNPQDVCDEGYKTSAHNLFSWSKLSIKDYLKLVCQTKNIQWYWPRIFYVYGPHQRKQSLIPTLIDSIHAGRIPQINTPFNANDFVYVDDVVEALNCFIDQNIESGVYNIGSGYATSIASICEQVATMFSSTIQFDWQSKKDTERTSFYADIQKITKHTGWAPKTSLSQGLKITSEAMLETYNAN